MRKIDASKNRSREVGVAQIRIGETRAFNNDVAKVHPTQIDVLEVAPVTGRQNASRLYRRERARIDVATGEGCAVKSCSSQASASHVAAFEMRSDERRVAYVRIGKIRSGEDGVVESRPVKVGAREIRPGHRSIAEVVVGEIGARIVTSDTFHRLLDDRSSDFRHLHGILGK